MTNFVMESLWSPAGAGKTTKLVEFIKSKKDSGYDAIFHIAEFMPQDFRVTSSSFSKSDNYIFISINEFAQKRSKIAEVMSNFVKPQSKILIVDDDSAEFTFLNFSLIEDIITALNPHTLHIISRATPRNKNV